MGLVAHWPLTGHLNDISGNNITHTTSGSFPIVDSGKIGKTYNFAASRLNVDYRSQGIILTNDTSVAFWIKIAAYPSDRMGIFETAYGAEYAINISSNGSIQWYYGTSGGQASPYRAFSTSANFLEVGVWAHIVLVKDTKNNQLRYYKNGELKHTETPNYEPTESSTTLKIGYSYTGYLNGNMNDFRIYDHALSEMEIKELSKGLILHYAFDNPEEEPTENLWDHNSNSVGGLTPYNNYGQPASITKLEGETFMGNPIYRLSFKVTNPDHLNHFRTALSSHGAYGGSLSWTENVKFVSSIYWRPVNKPDTVWGGTASNAGGWHSGGNTEVGGGWKRFYRYRTGVGVATKSDVVHHSFYCPSLELNEEILIDLAMPQTERGKIRPTPFTSTLRNGIAKDSSGLGGDGLIELNQSLSWTNSTPVGLGSFEFGGNNVVVVPNGYGKVTDQITISAWAYRDNWNDSTSERIMSSTESGGWQLGFNDSPGYISTPLYRNGAYINATYVRGNLSPGWHLITGTYDGRYLKLYVDGELKATTDGGGPYPISYNATNNIMIGAEPTSHASNPGGQYWNGKISDVRIYATALSDEDIMKLYKTRAELSNDGTLYSKAVLEDIRPVYNNFGRTISEFQSLSGWSSYGYGSTGVFSLLENQGALSGNAAEITRNSSSTGNVEIARSEIYSGIPTLKDGDKVTVSGYVKGIAGSIGRSAATSIHINPRTSAGTAVTLSDTWQRIHCTYTYDSSNTSQSINTYFYANLNGGDKFLLSNVQLEYGDKVGTFTESYRPPSQLPSSIDFNKPGIHETGTWVANEVNTVGITEGMVGYWPLDGDAKDYSLDPDYTSGTENNIIYETAVNSMGARFNGTNSYIATNLQMRNKTKSISLFIKPVSFPATSVILGQWYAPASWNITIASNGKVSYVSYNGSASNSLQSSGSLTLNQWNHLVITYDSSNRAAKIYINGVASGASTISVVENTASGNGIWFGRENGPNIYSPLNGSLSQVKIFERVLKEEEIKIEYNTMFKNKLQIHESGTLYAKDIEEY